MILHMLDIYLGPQHYVDGSFTKPICVVLRLLSGMFRNSGQFKNSAHQFVVMLPASFNIGVCMGAPIY